MALLAVSTACPNEDCQELTIRVTWGKPQKGQYGTVGVKSDAPHWTQQLWPEASIMPLPEEIPEEIRTTYRETVLVSAISGRAGAAMARRCLQGIVRDFFAIPENKRGNLGAELSYVKEKIDPDLWEAILAVRGIGDIGAHMDKNVDQIIDVTPDEARLLVELIETLFKDWYIARKRRRDNQRGLQALLEEKRGAQKKGKAKARTTATPAGPNTETDTDTQFTSS
ncbi:DUF4145 domain-containing protein [Shinella sumterensis]|nr:DUF4145 domain-containing protein [Shinella sumterensis]